MNILQSAVQFRSVSFPALLCLLAAFSLSSAADTTRIACVGNSITIGAGVAVTASYPARLQQMLGPTYKVLNCGCEGATMLKNGNKPYWTFASTQFKAAMALLPNIVTIELGTNDSKSSGGVDNWPSHKNEFIGDYKSMVDTFSNLSSHPKVWACYPLPAFSTAFLIDSLVIHYEILPKIKTVALDKGIPLIDLFTLMTPQDSLLPDGIHPNAQGHLMIAQKIYQMLKSDTLKIARSKNRLAAPSGGTFYQWYCGGIPVPAASGGAADTLIAKDTGSYRVSVGQSATNDDILVTNTVRVSAADVSSSTLPPVVRLLPGALAPRGTVSFYSLDGRRLATVEASGDVSIKALARSASLRTTGMYLAKAGTGTFILFGE